MFKFRNGARIPKGVNPELVAKELEKLCTEEEKLDPVSVVEAARSKKSPLHGAFCWDDTEAANLHRIWQARQLIRSISVVREDTKEKEPVYVSVTVAKKKEYQPLIQVATTETLMVSAINQVLKKIAELEASLLILAKYKPELIVQVKEDVERIKKVLEG